MKRKTKMDAEQKVPTRPETGGLMYRDTRPLPIAYMGASVTFNMPGWYCDMSDESVHDGSVLMVSDKALSELKANAEG